LDQVVTTPTSLTELLASRVAAHACAYLATIRERTVRATLSGDQLRALLGGSLPVRGEDPVRVIDTLAEAGLTVRVAPSLRAQRLDRVELLYNAPCASGPHHDAEDA
jgi:hypothetical protein